MVSQIDQTTPHPINNSSAHSNDTPNNCLMVSDIGAVDIGTTDTLQNSAQPTLNMSVEEDDSELSDNDVDGLGEDDGEYEMDSGVKHEQQRQSTRSTSQESRRPMKRKAVGIEEDVDIMNNPELYGIRRSVSYRLCITAASADLFSGSCSSNSKNCQFHS